jgi:hypothetical protein
MTAKEYLSELKEMLDYIQEKKDMVQGYRELATSISAPVNDIRVQTSRTDNGRVERYTIQAENLEREIDQDMQNYFQFQNMVIHQIRELGNTVYIQVLFKVHVQYKSIHQAAKEMGRNYHYIIGMHQKALKEFEKIHADMLKNAKVGKFSA